MRVRRGFSPSHLCTMAAIGADHRSGKGKNGGGGTGRISATGEIAGQERKNLEQAEQQDP
jgi:hypothetical protein